MSSIDCEQTLFCSKIREEKLTEEAKTSATLRVICELQVAKPRTAAQAVCGFVQSRSHTYDLPLAFFALFSSEIEAACSLCPHSRSLLVTSENSSFIFDLIVMSCKFECFSSLGM